jgi:hypothetical protein
MLPVLVVLSPWRCCTGDVADGAKRKAGRSAEGKPDHRSEGEAGREKLQAENMTEFEFFMELRINGVEQLGQVRLAILETNQISVFYYADDEVKPGCVFYRTLYERFTTVPEAGEYACVRCSHVMAMPAG